MSSVAPVSFLSCRVTPFFFLDPTKQFFLTMLLRPVQCVTGGPFCHGDRGTLDGCRLSPSREFLHRPCYSSYAWLLSLQSLPREQGRLPCIHRSQFIIWFDNPLLVEFSPSLLVKAGQVTNYHLMLFHFTSRPSVPSLPPDLSPYFSLLGPFIPASWPAIPFLVSHGLTTYSTKARRRTFPVPPQVSLYVLSPFVQAPVSSVTMKNHLLLMG